MFAPGEVLRLSTSRLGACMYPDMFSLAQAHEAWDGNGGIASAMLRTCLEETINCLIDLAETAKHYPGLKKQWSKCLARVPILRSTASTRAR
jgi:chromate reductase